MNDKQMHRAIRLRLRSDRKNLLLIALVIFIALGVSHIVTWSKYFYTSDNGMKFLQVVNLTSSEPSLALAYPAQKIIDSPMFAPFVGGHAVLINGRWYSVFPLLYAILNAPFYRLLGIKGLYVIPAASLLAIGCLTYLFTKRFLNRRYAFVTALMTALGSPLFFYGLTNWEHALATALGLAGVFILWDGIRNKQTARIITSGGIIGLACWLRPESYVFLAVVALIILVISEQNRIKLIMYYLAGATLTIASLLIFNASIYGNPLGPQVASNYGVLSHYDVIRLWMTTRLSIVGVFFPITSKRWLATYLFILASVVTLRLISNPKRSAYALIGIEISAFVVLAITLAYLRIRWRVSNFVEASPWMVLVPWIMVAPAENQRPTRRWIIGLGMLAFTFVAIVIASSPVPGWDSWGGRLFLMATPFWVLLGMLAYSSFNTYVSKHRHVRSHRFLLPIAFCTLLISSIIMQSVSAENLFLMEKDWKLLGDAVNRLPHDTVLITNSWWVPLVLAPDFYNHLFLHADSENDFCQLSEALFQRGVTSVAMISTPELLDTPSGECHGDTISLQELSREYISIWTPVEIQIYAVSPVTSPN